MRRIAMCGGFATVGLLLAFAAPSGARTHEKPAPKCPAVRPGLLEAADAQAEVYRRPEGSGPHGAFHTATIDGCEYDHGRVYQLGLPLKEDSTGDVFGVNSPTVAGPFVAFEEVPGNEARRVRVVDLRDGRTSRTASAGIGFVTAMVVKSDGAVAWIAENVVKPSECAVYALERAGVRVVASGAGISRYSLALAGSTVYWTQEDKPMSAPLH